MALLVEMVVNSFMLHNGHHHGHIHTCRTLAVKANSA
jgi:hypothetical protein